MVTLIKEFSEKPYFVGQVLIESGKKKGCYEAVTREFLTERAAAEALWIHKIDEESK